MVFNFPNATEIPIGKRVRIKVKCINNPNKVKLTVGKFYYINMLSILSKTSCRVKCDTGRNVWYNKSLFKLM
jgi:hypothetical protein